MVSLYAEQTEMFCSHGSAGRKTLAKQRNVEVHQANPRQALPPSAVQELDGNGMQEADWETKFKQD